MSIAGVEDYLIERIKAHFGARLRTVESLPADWDDDTFSRLLRATPGVFVVFGGGTALHQSLDLRSSWVVFAVTTHAGAERARRHGDSREIGAYEIIEAVVPLLHDHAVPGAGRLNFEEVENLFTGAIEKKGAAIYGARFTLDMTLDARAPAPQLDDFRHFHADHDLAPADGRFEATDDVILPQ